MILVVYIYIDKMFMIYANKDLFFDNEKNFYINGSIISLYASF